MGVAGTPRPKEDGGVGPSVADFDQDGDFDLFVANYGRSALYRNDAGLKFTDVSRERGIDLNGHGVTSGWGDLDNDGLPDLYVANFIAGQPLYRIVPRTVFFALTGRKLQLHGGGHSVRSFIHAADVADATVRVAEQAASGSTYHISTTRQIAIRDLVKLILDRLQRHGGNALEAAASLKISGPTLYRYWQDAKRFP